MGHCWWQRPFRGPVWHCPPHQRSRMQSAGGCQKVSSRMTGWPAPTLLQSRALCGLRGSWEREPQRSDRHPRGLSGGHGGTAVWGDDTFERHTPLTSRPRSPGRPVTGPSQPRAPWEVPARPVQPTGTEQCPSEAPAPRPGVVALPESTSLAAPRGQPQPPHGDHTRCHHHASSPLPPKPKHRHPCQAPSSQCPPRRPAAGRR